MRKAISWNVLGTASYAAWQWAMLLLVARLGSSPTDVGELALALSIAAPISILTNLGLRQVVATDMRYAHSDAEYLALRMISSLLGCALTAVVGLLYVGDRQLSIILACGLLKFAESQSDICYGLHQRALDERRVGLSQLGRAILQFFTFAFLTWKIDSLPVSIAAVAAVSLTILLIYDVPRAPLAKVSVSYIEGIRATLGLLWPLVVLAVPAGVAASVVSLGASLPRYFLEAARSTEEVGRYAVLMSVFLPGVLVANAIAQALLPQIAVRFSLVDRTAFKHILVLLLAIGATVSVLPVLAAWVTGVDPVAYLFGDSFSFSPAMLLAAFAANVLISVCGVANYVIAGMRAFNVQLIAAIASVSVGGVVGIFAIASWGVVGGLATIGTITLIQLLIYSAQIQQAITVRGSDGR